MHVDGIERFLYPLPTPGSTGLARWPSSPPSAGSSRRSPSYPLDWVEERSGLVGYTKWFLFRKVPRDISWVQTLGAASLTAFIVQALTGVFLAMYYKPDPNARTTRS